MPAKLSIVYKLPKTTANGANLRAYLKGGVNVFSYIILLFAKYYGLYVLEDSG